MTRQNVYFDTSSILDLFKVRRQSSKDDLAQIKSWVVEEKIRILISIYNIEELLPEYEYRKASWKETISWLMDFADMTCMIRPRDEVLKSALESCFNIGKWVPFWGRNDSFLDRIANPDEATGQILMQIIEDYKKEREQFAVMTREMYDDFKRACMLDDIDADEDHCFDDIWRTNARRMVLGLPSRIGINHNLSEDEADILLTHRCIRMNVGYLVSLFYEYLLKRQGLPKEKTLKSDFGDFIHTISASTADIFVTEDGPLRKILDRIPSCLVKITNFSGLEKLLES